MPAQAKCPDPNCGQSFVVPDGVLGKKIQCPSCKRIIQVTATKTTVALKTSETHDISLAVPSQHAAARPLPKAAIAATPGPRARPLWWLCGGAMAGAVVVGFIAILVGGAGYFLWTRVGSDVDKDYSKKLETQRQELAASHAKAENDSAAIAALEKKLSTIDAKTPPDTAAIREELKAALAAAKAGEEKVAQLRTDFKEAEAKHLAELNELSNAVNANVKAAKSAKDEAEQLRAQAAAKLLDAKGLLEALKLNLGAAEKRAQQQHASIAALRKILANVATKEGVYKFIDDHALAATPETEKSVATLADYLAGGAIDDRERVRAIYSWIVERIAYDFDALEKKLLPISTPEGVLQRKVAVCEGFVALFLELCKHAELEAVPVKGQLAVWPITSGDELKSQHSWIAVKLEGTWGLVDPTNASANKKIPLWIDFYFLTPPEKFIFQHLPEEPKWQLLTPPVSAEDFKELRKLPFTKVVHFGLDSKGTIDAIRGNSKIIKGYEALFQTEPGILQLATLPELLEMGQSERFRGFVLVRKVETNFKSLEVPLEKHLQPGKEYIFRVQSKEATSIFVQNGDKSTHFERKGEVFELKIMPQAGPLQVAIGKGVKGKGEILLEYIAE